MKVSKKLLMLLRRNSGAAAPSINTHLSSTILGLSPLAYFKFNDASGTTATDYSGNGLNGVYHGGYTLGAPGCGDGDVAVQLDGVNGSYIDITAVGDSYDENAGTIFMFAKADSPSIWTDGLAHFLIRFIHASNANIFISKSSLNNSVSGRRSTGVSDNKTVNTTLSASDWFSIALTWSVADNQLKMYVNNAQVGSTVTSINSMAAAFSSALVGANTVSTSSWLGAISHTAIWARVLSAAEIATLTV
jgi:hypothetical protein